MSLIGVTRRLAVAGFLIGWTGMAQAQGETCDELWLARNSIYKAAGYCFRTTRGIRAFGNAGCSFDDVNDVPLSSRQRRTVAEIQIAERRLRCPR